MDDFVGFTRHKAGRSDVTFSPDGRLMHGGPASLPEANPSPERERINHDLIDDYRSYDAHREHRRTRQTHNENRSRHYERRRDDNHGRQTQSSRSRRTQTVDRTDYPSNNQRGYDYRNYNTHFDRGYTRDFDAREFRDDFMHTNRHQNRRRYDAPLPTRKRRNHGKCCSKRNPLSFVFIFNAVLILGCAMINILMCRDYHYYCGFWVGIFVLEFGIIGAFHRGNYRNQCRNWSYIILGFLSCIVAYVGTAMVSEKLVPDIMFLAENKSEPYVLKQNALGQPYINGNITDTQRAWLCLAFDCSLVALYIFDFISLLAVCVVIDKFYNSAYKVTGKVEPWCYPACFNPYGQVPLGQFVAFLGVLARYACVHVASDTPWYKYWGPVWAGGLLVVSGSLSATSMKRPDRRGRAGVTLTLQFLTIIACIGAFVLQILGIVDNASFIDSAKESGATRLINGLYVGSIIIYSVAAFFLLFAIVFSVSLFIKVAFAVCDVDDQEPYRRENRSYTDSNSSSDRPPVFPRRDPTRGYKYGADYYSDWQRY